jgi:glutathione peroxidase
LNKLLKDLKCALIVNVASKCGHTSKHYRELVELKNKFGDHGFEIFAFPCN